LKIKKEVRFLSLFILIFMCLCSCASRTRENRLYIFITDRARFILLPPEGIENPMDMAQFITASYQGQNYFFTAWVRADETGMDMTLINELGAAMGDLSYRNGVITFSSHIIPGSFRPEYIVADFQLCFYDPVLLRRALEDAGLSLEIEGNTRRIFNRRNLIIEIERAPDKVRLINHLRGYIYSLEGDFK
jgi:hypothetical protein